MDALTPDPAALADQLHARCRKLYTPCGDGRMVWRVWGEGDPVVLLHGGSGSWTHWFRNIPVLERRYTLYVADLPGLGDSGLPPRGYDHERLLESVDHLAETVVNGLREILPPPARYHLVGFSFGAVSGGHLAAREGARLKSFTMIGASALGVPWPGLAGALRRVEADMTEAEILDVHRHNLHLIMLAAPPPQIDDLAAWLQLENTKRSRILSHPVAPTDILLQALRRTQAPLTAIWGLQDVFLQPDPDSRVQALQAVHPEVAVHLLEGAGHWAMYEAADTVNAYLLGAFAAHSNGYA
jgi:pimeloyl-ACP methyl ester carboxylesterase